MEELPNRGHSKHKAKLIQTPRVRHVQIGPEEKMALKPGKLTPSWSSGFAHRIPCFCPWHHMSPGTMPE